MLTGYFAQAENLAPAAFLGAAAAYAFSLAQRRLSNEARGIRRRATAVEGQITWSDGSEETLDTARLLAPHESALRALAAGHVLIASALVFAGLTCTKGFRLPRPKAWTACDAPSSLALPLALAFAAPRPAHRSRPASPPATSPKRRRWCGRGRPDPAACG